MGERRLWLLELELGDVIRVSTEMLELQTEAGVELHYGAGLVEPDVSLAALAGHDEVSASFELVTEDDWALIAAQGVPLEGRRATLRLWEEGTTLEHAIVVLRGVLASVSYGAVGESLSFDIVRSLKDRASVLPHPQAVVDAKTWPITGSYVLPEGSEGAVYPLVIGCPGHGGPYGAVPVVYAQMFGSVATNAYLIVSDGKIAAGTVRLFGRSSEAASVGAGLPADRTVSQVVDLLGRTVSVITPPSVGDLEYLVGLQDDGTYGRGTKDRRGNALRGAGSVSRWVMEEHLDAPVDHGRLMAVLAKLDAYNIDTFIPARSNLWEWYTQEVLPVLPIEMRESSIGLYPAFWRWNATARHSVDHLDGTPGTGTVSRVSPLSASGEIYNEIIVEYRRSSDPDRGYLSRRIATATGRSVATLPAPTADDRIRGSSLLASSQHLYGVRPLTLQLGAVWDDSTAELVLRDRILQHAWPRRTVSYEGGPELASRRVGDVVTVTDPDVHLDSAVALVWDVTPGTAPVLDLLLLDHPLQIRRADS